MNKNRKLSLILALVMVLSTFTVAFAGNGDLTDIGDSKVIEFGEWTFDEALFSKITFTSEEYKIEVNNKKYSLDAIMEKMSQGKDLEEAAQAIDGPVVPTELEVVEVSAINATTVEVTFNKAVESLSAADFAIDGIEVLDAKFKAQSNDKVVVLTTTEQSEQLYKLVYKQDSPKPFWGISDLGSVKLVADNYQVVIVPSENKLTPVEITAELVNFPEGAEASIDFSTTFGKVVKSQTTQGGKTTFQLTPLETLFDQTAIVTGTVVEVKNPKTGETFPEFRNSKVATINVNFTIKQKDGEEDLKSYRVETAYAEQADRVYLRVSGGVDGIIGNLLDFQPQKLMKATNSLTEKQMYLHLHDVLFSNINAVVDAHKGAKTEAQIKALKEELKDVFVVDNKDITVADLKNILRKDTIGVTGSRFDTIYQPLGGTKKTLNAEINNIPDKTLQGILDYYKLLSKFVVLDNIKDSQAPQAPDSIYSVEYIYKEGDNTLVLVLPGQRSSDDMNYLAAKHTQAKDLSAKYIRDNASHQVIFVNNIEKDKYEIKGDPTFKLEDARNVRLIDVARERYQVQEKSQNPDGTDIETKIYCPIPYAVEVEDADGYNPGEGGGTTPIPGTDPSYSGTVKLTALDYTTSEDYRLKDKAEDKGDKLGELKIVFSESVAVESTDIGKYAQSALEASNWTINGRSLANVGVDVNLRLVSTDPAKQLRDAIVITFNSSAGIAGMRDVKWIEDFIEEASGRDHRIEVSKIGDWASLTDIKNIVDTEAKDYKGAKASDATPWGTYPVSGTPGTTTSVISSIAQGNAFVVRAAADVSDPAKDIIRVLYSEPMKIDGTDSVLEKANYALDGLRLPVNGTSIKIGLEGITSDGLCASFEKSPCGVTIELPKGYLGSQEIANTHVLTISNVKGINDEVKLDERIQLAYARQYTITGSEIVINGLKITSNVIVNGCITSISGKDLSAKGKVYFEADEKTPVDVNAALDSMGKIRFFREHLVAGPVVVDKAALNAAIASAKAVGTTGKTAASVEALNTAITSAEAVVAKADATQAEVDSAKSELEAAVAGLVDDEPVVESDLKIIGTPKLNEMLGTLQVKVNDQALVAKVYVNGVVVTGLTPADNEFVLPAEKGDFVQFEDLEGKKIVVYGEPVVEELTIVSTKYTSLLSALIIKVNNATLVKDVKLDGVSVEFQLDGNQINVVDLGAKPATLTLVDLNDKEVSAEIK